jgi:hypothetical protein
MATLAKLDKVKGRQCIIGCTKQPLPSRELWRPWTTWMINFRKEEAATAANCETGEGAPKTGRWAVLHQTWCLAVSTKWWSTNKKKASKWLACDHPRSKAWSQVIPEFGTPPESNRIWVKDKVAEKEAEITVSSCTREECEGKRRRGIWYREPGRSKISESLRNIALSRRSMQSRNWWSELTMRNLRTFWWNMGKLSKKKSILNEFRISESKQKGSALSHKSREFRKR